MHEIFGAETRAYEMRTKCKHNSNASHIERCHQVGEIPLMRIVRFECGSMFDIDMCQGWLRARPSTDQRSSAIAQPNL